MQKMEINRYGQPVGKALATWAEVQAPEFKSLIGTFCRIDAMDVASHARDLFEELNLNNDGQSWTYLPYGPFADFTDFSDWLLKTNATPDTQLYAISTPQSKVLGIAGYSRINPAHGSIEVGHIHYAKSLQKTPAATEAMFLMMRHVFDDLGYRRYEWKCNSFNEASKTAALRLGFKFEGTFRQSNVFKGHNRDTAWFSIIDGEWPALKQKFIHWLNPSNFEPNGNQIRRLGDFAG